MSIILKTPEEIAKMRIAGRLAAEVLEMIAEYVKPGITTDELNDICHRYIVDTQQAIPAPLNYHGFPKSICTSPNFVVCHGIPNDKKLKEGDIINIDITVLKEGYHGDTSQMFAVGDIAPHAQRLIDVTQECLYKAIRIIKPGVSLYEIGNIIQQHAEKNHYSVVREYCGHGIGRIFHEDPQVLHYATERGKTIKLQPGMVFTIEPMINAGKRHVKLLKDNWTVVTKDHRLSAQWEHTIALTDNGHEVLTLRKGEVI